LTKQIKENLIGLWDRIVTFAHLIETIQKSEIDWKTRECSIMLWARYCGTELSKRFKQ
jgi:hypothetical protein